MPIPISKQVKKTKFTKVLNCPIGQRKCALDKLLKIQAHLINEASRLQHQLSYDRIILQRRKKYIKNNTHHE